jgi:hydrogenase-1 operon protein HyaF
MNPDIAAPCQTTLNTGMAWSVLSEVHTLLKRFAESGESGAVDLRGLPLTSADRDQLEELLGRGEVHCTLSLMGRSEVWETAFPGVWWIRHLGAGDKVASETLEITNVPDILLAHADDITAAAIRLERQLDQGPAAVTSPELEESTHD